MALSESSTSDQLKPDIVPRVSTALYDTRGKMAPETRKRAKTGPASAVSIQTCRGSRTRVPAMSAAAACLAPGALAFGRLSPLGGSGYVPSGFSHPHERKVAEASARCHESLGHGLGPPWMQCVVDTLLVQQAAALSENRDDYFPVVNHSYTPFAAQHEFHNEPGYVQHDLLKNLLRNATCDIDDGGSQPVRSFVWEHRPTDPCGGTPTDDSHGDSVFQHKAGFLPAGNDLTELDGILSEEAAKERCAADSRCQGFTFSKAGPTVGAKHNMIFKSFGDDVSMSPDWQTWRRRDDTTPAAASHIEGRSRAHQGPQPLTRAAPCAGGARATRSTAAFSHGAHGCYRAGSRWTCCARRRRCTWCTTSSRWRSAAL